MAKKRPKNSYMEQDLINKTEAWRQIPPELKIKMMNQAHANGVFVVIMTLGITLTCAAALKIKMIMWIGFLLSPFVFQFATSKAWRGIKPLAMMHFLAVRSAARRFAYASKSRDLDLQLLFPGEIEKVYGQDQIQEALESVIDDNIRTEAWITLFADTVIIMSEQIGGAQLEWSCPITHELSIEVDNHGEGEYNSQKEITLVEQKATYQRRVKLSSFCPAALVVFQKKLQAAIDEKRQTAEQLQNLSGGKNSGTLTGPQDEEPVNEFRSGLL